MTGHVIKVFGRYYTVLSGDTAVNSVLRGKMKMGITDNFSNPVAVGDIVEFEVNDEGLGIISRVHQRRNVFTRKDGVRSRRISLHVILTRLLLCRLLILRGLISVLQTE
jgi:ribosome biogenesis GTPase